MADASEDTPVSNALEGARAMLTTCIDRFVLLAEGYEELGCKEIALAFHVLAEDATAARTAVISRLIR